MVVDAPSDVWTSGGVPTIPTSSEVSHDDQQEELVDYEPASVRLRDNVVYSSFDYYLVAHDKKRALLDFAPQSIIF